MESIPELLARWAELIVAVGGAIMAVGYGLKRVYRMAKNIERVLENSESATTRLDAIEKELKPNGGSSLRDAVNRIDRELQALKSSGRPTA
jgi:hypothetical protein